MKKMGLFLLIMAVMISAFQYVYASEKQKQSKPSKQQVVAFVKSAVDYAKKNGKDMALKEFMNRQGMFFKGELYIYSLDFNGECLAHGGQSQYVGKNIMDLKDSNGVLIVQELIKSAGNNGGWVKYMCPNPKHANDIEPKLSYVEKVDETWFLGSGMYE